MERKHARAARGARARRPVRRVVADRWRRGGMAAPTRLARRQGDVHRGRGAGPPASGRRRAAAGADEERLLSRLQPARLRRAPGQGAGDATRAACAGRMRLAYVALRMSAGADRGCALGRPDQARDRAMSGAGASGAGASGAGGAGASGSSGAGAGGAAALPDPATFTSGGHGTVGGKRGSLRRLSDRALDAWLLASGARRRIRALTDAAPVRDVLVVAIRTAGSTLLDGSLAELRRSRHRVRIAEGSVEVLGGGKFQNANSLLAGQDPADWTFLVDDDVALPPDFLDGFIALAEAFGFELAQPAQTLPSHAAWPSARRAPFAIARQTNFVEIGPVTAFSRRAADQLLPFPDLKMGWGLDLHWATLGFRLGVVDAVPVRHETRPVGGAYSSAEATAEAQRFLADHPYLDAREAGRTLHTYRRVPR